MVKFFKKKFNSRATTKVLNNGSVASTKYLVSGIIPLVDLVKPRALPDNMVSVRNGLFAGFPLGYDFPGITQFNYTYIEPIHLGLPANTQRFDINTSSQFQALTNVLRDWASNGLQSRIRVLQVPPGQQPGVLYHNVDQNDNTAPNVLGGVRRYYPIYCIILSPKDILTECLFGRTQASRNVLFPGNRNNFTFVMPREDILRLIREEYVTLGTTKINVNLMGGQFAYGISTPSESPLIEKFLRKIELIYESFVLAYIADKPTAVKTFFSRISTYYSEYVGRKAILGGPNIRMKGSQETLYSYWIIPLFPLSDFLQDVAVEMDISFKYPPLLTRRTTGFSSSYSTYKPKTVSSFYKRRGPNGRPRIRFRKNRKYFKKRP